MLETLLALLGNHHPTELQLLGSGYQTLHIKFPDSAAVPTGPVQLHETRDNRKYLSHAAVSTDSSRTTTHPAPAPVRASRRGRKSQALTYHEVLQQLGSEDPVLQYLYGRRAKQPPVRKGTWVSSSNFPYPNSTQPLSYPWTQSGTDWMKSPWRELRCKITKLSSP